MNVLWVFVCMATVYTESASAKSSYDVRTTQRETVTDNDDVISIRSISQVF